MSCILSAHLWAGGKDEIEFFNSTATITFFVYSPPDFNNNLISICNFASK
jgi:hypothetical protein